MFSALKKEYVLFFGILAIFLALRLPAIHAPYHQDEYKWPIIVNPELTPPGGIPHPPLGEAIYRATFNIFGSDNFRVTPLIFSVLNITLLYIFIRRRFNNKVAMWSILFFAVSFYSVLASLMVDTDGSILPFFFLLALIFYDKALQSQGRRKIIFSLLMLGAIIAGILVKISFILAIGAIAIDFAISQRNKLNKRNIFIGLATSLGLIGFVAVLLFLSQKIFPGFNLSKAIVYWETFVKGFSDRNFFQTLIQFIKGLFYLSPFLVFSGLISVFNRDSKIRVFQLYICLGLIFYLVMFDFSGGALDRYLQYLVLPLCVISGYLTEKFLSQNNFKINKKYLFLGIIPTVVVFCLQFLPQFVPSLYPKALWISRILSLKWNFLYPFSGGSGPLGFYISWMFIALLWILGTIFSFLLFRKNIRKEVWIMCMFLGFIYTSVFTEEYLFGKINGYAPGLVRNAAAYIKNNPDIQKVVVYNDNGGNEIMKTGKYEKRLYTSPQFDTNQKIDTINNFEGHYLEIDVPPIDPNSIYRKYLDSCRVVYSQKSGYIDAKVYDCRNAPDIKK